MGIPGLFKFVKTRYPYCMEVADDNKVIPVYDNLYIDFNGIIHYAAHGISDISYKVSYEVLASRLIVLLDKLISFVNPQKLVYISVDGTVPRSKLNQQRCRRFQSSKTMNNANSKHENIELFDSNVISPGTEYMERVNEIIKYYIQMRIDTDPSWKRLCVLYSSHRQSKEGEHKIMEYIRYQIENGKYNDKERSIIYGSDADLLILVSMLHKQNIDILRDNNDLKASSETFNLSQVPF